MPAATRTGQEIAGKFKEKSGQDPSGSGQAAGSDPAAENDQDSQADPDPTSMWVFCPLNVRTAAVMLIYAFTSATATNCVIALVMDEPLMHGIHWLHHALWETLAFVGFTHAYILGTTKTILWSVLPKVFAAELFLTAVIMIPVIYLGTMTMIALQTNIITAIVEKEIVRHGLRTKKEIEKGKPVNDSWNFTAFGGLILMAFYPTILSKIPASFFPEVWAGSILPAGLAILENASTILCMTVYQKIGSPRYMIFTVGMVFWSVNLFLDANRTAGVMAAAITDGTSRVWITTLGVAFLQGVLTRTGWLNFAILKVTQKPFMLPNMVFHYAQHGKYYSSYVKVTMASTLVSVRLLLGTLPAYFNSNFVLLCVCLVAEMMLEDILTYGMEATGMCPKMNAAYLEYYSKMDFSREGYKQGYSPTGEKQLYFEKDCTDSGIFRAFIASIVSANAIAVGGVCTSLGYRKVWLGQATTDWWDVLLHWPPRN